ncbi:MAG TPA: transporter substrate-binding domain-containing protein [Methanospirillum sp.]|nr:transporter substrate-binding domain-containing protein [Methanospirillum sp.]
MNDFILFVRRILFVTLATVLVMSVGCLADQSPESLSVVSPPDDLTFYTEQLPPYNYVDNGTLKGLSIDILEDISTKAGVGFSREKVHVGPWEEGYHSALGGNKTVIFSTARIPERESSFKWVGPISVERYVLFGSRDTNLSIMNHNDLKGLRIGVIAGDASIQLLLDAGVDNGQLVTETNVSELITQLTNKQIDLWAYPEITGRFYAEQVTGNSYIFKVVYPLEEVEIYYAFSRDTNDSTVQSFQKALDALKQEKEDRGISAYERILGTYIPSIGLSHLQYLTEDWAPFNYHEGGVATGISVEILESVFRILEVNRTRADIRFVPLSEGFSQAQGNTSTVLFSIVRSPDREALYQWAGPFTKGSFVIFAPVLRNITISSPADLNQYRIGAVNGTIENTLLTNIGVNASQIVTGMVPDDLIRMLEEGQIDLWATGDITGRYEMEQVGINPDEYEIVHTMGENDFYFIFSKDVPDTLIRTFNQALETVRKQKDSSGDQ